MENLALIFFIGVGPSNFKLPLPIEWMPGIGALRLNQDRIFEFWREMPKKVCRGAENRKIKEWGPLMNKARIWDKGNI
jgi:hypothetical protein